MSSTLQIQTLKLFSSIMFLLNPEFKRTLLQTIATLPEAPKIITIETMYEIISSIKLEGFGEVEQITDGIRFKKLDDEAKILTIKEASFTTTRPFLTELSSSFVSGKSLDIGKIDNNFLANSEFSLTKPLSLNKIQQDPDIKYNVNEIITLVYLVSLTPFLLIRSAS